MADDEPPACREHGVPGFLATSAWLRLAFSELSFEELDAAASSDQVFIHDTAPGGPFDAITARLVLMYVPDPAAVLASQAKALRPGGLVVPIEFCLSTAGALPPTPLVTQVLSWLTEAFTRAGIHTSLGPRLWAVLQDAGLRPQGMLGVQPHFGSGDTDGARLLAGIIRTAAPLIERTGVATAAQIGAETLLQRLSEELQVAAAVFAHPILLGAWATSQAT